VAKTGEVPLPPRGEQLIGGHAVLAVGYDDRASVHRPQLVGHGLGDQGLLHDAVRLPDRPAARRDFWAIYTVEPDGRDDGRRRRPTDDAKKSTTTRKRTAAKR
jgi:hypothetical protein